MKKQPQISKQFMNGFVYFVKLESYISYMFVHGHSVIRHLLLIIKRDTCFIYHLNNELQSFCGVLQFQENIKYVCLSRWKGSKEL